LLDAGVNAIDTADCYADRESFRGNDHYVVIAER
jgi:aryl-alcohol dehydrogenase-like predicted oxidoreductase